jgi:DNA-directed RNA polymerase subunit H
MSAKTEKIDKTQKEAEFDIFLSDLVPKHEILTDEEKKQVLNEFNISEKQLPKIRSTDAAARKLGAKKGEVIRITRKSPTAGDYYYYRIVF